MFSNCSPCCHHCSLKIYFHSVTSVIHLKCRSKHDLSLFITLFYSLLFNVPESPFIEILTGHFQPLPQELCLNFVPALRSHWSPYYNLCPPDTHPEWYCTPSLLCLEGSTLEINITLTFLTYCSNVTISGRFINLFINTTTALHPQPYYQCLFPFITLWLPNIIYSYMFIFTVLFLVAKT